MFQDVLKKIEEQTRKNHKCSLTIRNDYIRVSYEASDFGWAKAKTFKNNELEQALEFIKTL